MLVNATPDRLSQATEHAWQLPRPYLIARSVIFSRPEYPSVWSIDDPIGKPCRRP